MRYAVATWHGENRSVFHIVDAQALDTEQPAVVVSKDSFIEASSLAAVLNLRNQRTGKYPAKLAGRTVIYVAQYGGYFCAKCMNGQNGSDATVLGDDPQWNVVAMDDMVDCSVRCDHCHVVINPEVDGVTFFED